jgi:hypothetical protein
LGGVCFGKKIILIDKISSTWSTLTLNHFLISDYDNFMDDTLSVSSSPYDIARHPLHREYVFVSSPQVPQTHNAAQIQSNHVYKEFVPQYKYRAVQHNYPILLELLGIRQ